MSDEEWPTVRIPAARLEQLEAERDIAQKMLDYLEREMAEVESNIGRGKGTWPNADYIRDDTWLRWYATHRALFLMREEWHRLLNENSAAKQSSGGDEVSTEGEGCGIWPILLGRSEKFFSACIGHDSEFVFNDTGEQTKTRKQVDDEFLARMLEASERTWDRVVAYTYYFIARALGVFWW